jgi:hypothetical protein
MDAVSGQRKGLQRKYRRPAAPRRVEELERKARFSFFARGAKKENAPL